MTERKPAPHSYMLWQPVAFIIDFFHFLNIGGVVMGKQAQFVLGHLIILKIEGNKPPDEGSQHINQQKPANDRRPVGPLFIQFKAESVKRKAIFKTL